MMITATSMNRSQPVQEERARRSRPTPHEVERDLRARSFLLWPKLAGAVGSLATGFWLLRHPSAWPIQPICIFHAVTGGYCPGCGATRALCALSRGDLPAAWHYNALLVAVLPLLVIAAWQPRRLAQARPVWIWTLVLLIGLFTVARNIPLPPFLALTP